MGNHSDGTKAQGSAVVTSSEESEEQFRNPGLPPHRPRLTDDAWLFALLGRILRHLS